MAVKIGSARIDENGRAHGGKAGDQTGKEVSTQSWYLHAKGWRVFRAKDPAVAERIAQDMQWACDNKNIGYDQYQRDTLYNAAKPLGFNCKKIAVSCETDCSALVRVCVNYAGVTVGNFRTTDEPAKLLATGAFVELTGSKYQSQSTYLGRGDILCTKTQGHTVVVLSNGSKFEGTIQPKTYALGERVIAYGMEGPDVKQMQELLIDLGYDLGKYGADGDFGDCTELAVKAFQRDVGLETTGKLDAKTLESLSAAQDKPAPTTGRAVKIVGGNCYIRESANTEGKILGVAHKGESYPYGGVTFENGWNLIEYQGKNAAVSGKYSQVVD